MMMKVGDVVVFRLLCASNRPFTCLGQGGEVVLQCLGGYGQQQGPGCFGMG